MKLKSDKKIIEKNEKIIRQSYSKDDLSKFNTLVDFDALNFQSLPVQKNANPVITKYTQSDKEKFNNIKNKNEDRPEISNITKLKKNHLEKNLLQFPKYNEVDEKQFRKINLYTSSYFNYTNHKKENQNYHSINYTKNDLSAFNKILNEKSNLNKNKTEKSQSKLKVKKDLIKIIDFDKIEKKTKNYKNTINNNFKIKYYD